MHYILKDKSIWTYMWEREGNTRRMMLYYEKGMKIYWVCPFLWKVEAWNKDALTSFVSQFLYCKICHSVNRVYWIQENSAVHSDCDLLVTILLLFLLSLVRGEMDWSTINPLRITSVISPSGITVKLDRSGLVDLGLCGSHTNRFDNRRPGQNLKAEQTLSLF